MRIEHWNKLDCGKAKVKDVKFDHLQALIFKNGFTWLIYDHSDHNLI